MKTYLTLFLFILSIQLSSQNKITGKIIDNNDEPIPFVSVILNTQDSIFVKGAKSDESGNFIISEIPNGDYFIQISSLGFSPQKIVLNSLSQTISLGQIVLKEESTSLNEITVTASSRKNEIDRLIIFITDNQKKYSTNGIDLLTTLDLPGLIIDPIRGSISLPNANDKILLCINGAKADFSTIKAISPDEIIRVEYIDNPGVRYGNATVVINYLLKRKISGGSIGINANNALTSTFGNDQISFKINHKKSEFAFIYNAKIRDLKKVWSNQTTDFIFENNSKIIRYEEGIPGRMKENSHELSLNYNLLDNLKYLNITFDYNFSSQDKITVKNQFTSLDLSRKTFVRSGAKDKQRLPALDIYYSQNIKNNQMIIFNLVGTYINSSINQLYYEMFDNTLISDIVSDVDGNKYSIIGEGIYEKTFFNKNKFTAGLKYTQAFADNKYSGTINSIAKMKQNDTYLYSEYLGRVDKFTYSAGVGITRTWLSQEGEESRTDYIFRPKFSLQYNFKPQFFVRLKGEVINTAPSLAALSNVIQYKDTLQLSKGNPHLKSNVNYQLGLNVGWNKQLLGLNWSANYRYSPKAIMQDIYRHDNLFISTFDNQKNWQKLNTELTLTFKPLKQYININFSSGINKYWSNGNSYSHDLTNFYYRGTIMGMYKNFMAYIMAMSANNNLWGESIVGGEVVDQIALTYKFKNGSIGISSMNLLTGEYKRKNENLNQYAQSKSIAYINNFSKTIFLNFSWNLEFGRKTTTTKKSLNNADRDTGIIKE